MKAAIGRSYRWLHEAAMRRESLARLLPGGRVELARRRLGDYVQRGVNLYNRDSELKQRFATPWDADFERLVDTEAILHFRELQEVGVPFPPSREMSTVGGETDLRLFLAIGHACYLSVRRHIPPDLAMPIKVLDFGVGCARTMRYFFRDLEGFRCYGCDVDKRAIAYLEESVSFIDARLTGNLPPLPYRAGLFDLVYSISVFTHLDSKAIDEWLREVYRVLRPGGVFQVSLHGTTALSLLAREPDRRKLIGIVEKEYRAKKDEFGDRGFLWLAQPVGSADIDSAQYGIAFISRDQFRRRVEGLFELAEYLEGEIGGWQDLAVLRRR